MSDARDQQPEEFLANLTASLVSAAAEWRESSERASEVSKGIEDATRSIQRDDPLHSPGAALRGAWTRAGTPPLALDDTLTELGERADELRTHELDLDAFRQTLEDAGDRVEHAAGALWGETDPRAAAALGGDGDLLVIVEAATSSINDAIEAEQRALSRRAEAITTFCASEGMVRLVAFHEEIVDTLIDTANSGDYDYDVADITEGVSELVRQLRHDTEEIGDAVADPVKKGLEDLDELLGERGLDVLRRYDNTLEAWEALLETGLETAKDIPTAAGRLVEACQTLAKGCGTLSENFGTLTEQWRGPLMDALGRSPERLEQHVSRLAALHGQLTGSIKKLSEATTSRAQELRAALATTGTRITENATRHAGLASSLEQAIQGSRESIHERQQGAVETVQELTVSIQTSGKTIMTAHGAWDAACGKLIEQGADQSIEAERHRQRVVQTVTGLSARIRGEFTEREQQVTGDMSGWLDTSPVQVLVASAGSCQNVASEGLDTFLQLTREGASGFAQSATDMLDVLRGEVVETGRHELERVFQQVVEHLFRHIQDVIVQETELMMTGAATTSALAPVLPHLVACYHALSVLEAAIKLRNALPF